jgi:PDZ domain-containing protein
VIGVVTREEPVDAPFDVEITLEDVGGPSAGLMFALGILDKLGEPSLTGGAYIAGTGEISAQGEVGPIGGIAQKLVAAKAKGVDAFLVPADNCAEAVLRAPDDLPLVEVGSLAQALTALEALREDEQPSSAPRADAGGQASSSVASSAAARRGTRSGPVSRSSCSGVSPRTRSTHA